MTLPVAVADTAGIAGRRSRCDRQRDQQRHLGDGTAAENVSTLNDPAIGSFGTIALAADGSYTYTLDNANPLVQQLAPTETLTETTTTRSPTRTATPQSQP